MISLFQISIKIKYLNISGASETDDKRVSECTHVYVCVRVRHLECVRTHVYGCVSAWACVYECVCVFVS